MHKAAAKVVILGTGGTIAGTSATPLDNVHYRAAQLSTEQLIAAVPGLAGESLEAEQVAQVDSKDMGFEIWLGLARRIEYHLARDDIAGVVVTHGTDTLEETAYFLQRVLAPRKPVVLTAAMRPATALLRDGPQNLLDALSVARIDGARGVVALLAGTLHSAHDVRKVHSYRLDAFSSGDAGVLGHVEEGRLRQLREWPAGTAIGLERLPQDAQAWPLVEIITSHAGASGALVQAALAQGVKGLIVAGTGNGHVHQALEAALHIAQQRGVRIWRCTRCLAGPVFDEPELGFASAGVLTPVQARVEMLLYLMAPPARAFPVGG
ncbi:MAG: asparaginase [Burkholderiaceae bacterium]